MAVIAYTTDPPPLGQRVFVWHCPVCCRLLGWRTTNPRLSMSCYGTKDEPHGRFIIGGDWDPANPGQPSSFPCRRDSERSAPAPSENPASS